MIESNCLAVFTNLNLQFSKTKSDLIKFGFSKYEILQFVSLSFFRSLHRTVSNVVFQRKQHSLTFINYLIDKSWFQDVLYGSICLITNYDLHCTHYDLLITVTLFQACYISVIQKNNRQSKKAAVALNKKFTPKYFHLIDFDKLRNVLSINKLVLHCQKAIGGM